MGKSGSKVPKSKNIMGAKKVSRGILRSKLLWAAIAVALLVSGFFAYKYIHYVSAPEAIKLIRQEKIYNYESENLKIVRRTEDYGGTDWKGVSGNPTVNIGFSNNISKEGLSNKNCTQEIKNFLLSEKWQIIDEYKTSIGIEGAAYVLSRESKIRLESSVRPTSLLGELCTVSVTED